MRRLLPYLLLIFFFNNSYSQIIQRQKTFSATNDSVFNLTVGGYLDAHNTFSLLDFQDQRYKVGFQSMKSITLTNTGNSVLRNPRIVINNRGNWYNLLQLNEEIFQGNATFKDKFLSLWNFTLENAIHRYYPESGYSIGPPVKLFSSYGYGQCFNLASMITMLPENIEDKRYDLFYTLHSISEFKDSTHSAVFDGDIRTFYLNYDNSTLASMDEVSRDRYLVKRTHHYGKQFKYDYGVNNYISQVYGINGVYSGKVNKVDYSINYKLRPGESLTYTWDSAQYIYSNWTSDALNTEAGNCIFSLTVDSTTIDYLDSVFYYSNNIKVVKDSTSAYVLMTNDSSRFNILLDYSFPILNTEVALTVHSNTSDSLVMFISTDSVSWKQKMIYLDSGKNFLSYDFKDEMMLLYNIGPINQVFFRFNASSDSSSLQLLNLNIKTFCQVNRFFLPSVQLGENNIAYLEDSNNESSVDIDIQWQESSENHPPSPVTSPIYPADQAIVTGLKFDFTWENAADMDGDEIINYEFELSDREDMKYPLSPTFNVYTNTQPLFQFSGEIKSSISARQKDFKNVQLGDIDGLRKIFPNSSQGIYRTLAQEINKFQIPLDGLLNSGQKYYWRVRAQDNQGNWGEWSPIWSFTPTGVMSPQEFTIDEEFDSLNSIQKISLSWKKNQIGFTPDHYEIHGSNEWLGFAPGDSTLLTITQDTVLEISSPESVKFCYRVIAVDSLGQKSGPSKYLDLKGPYVLNRPDTVYFNKPYQYTLKLPQVWYPNISFYDNQSMAIKEEYTFDIKSLPSWLNFNPSTRTFFGTPDSMLFSDSIANQQVIEIAINGDLIRKNHSQYLIIPFQKVTVKNEDRDSILGGDPMDSLQIIDGPSAELFDNNFYIFPNPVYNDFVVVFNSKEFKKEEIVVEVFDMNGKNILKKIIAQPINKEPSYSYRVDLRKRLRGIKSGVYFLKILANNKYYLKKIEYVNASNK